MVLDSRNDREGAPQGGSRSREIPLRWMLRLLCVCVPIFAVATAMHKGVRAATDAEAGKDARQAYQSKVAASYSYKFGSGTPFLPSNLTTDNGQFIQPESYLTAAYCGHCHQASAAQWRESAHSNSNRTPWYQRNVQLLKAEKGTEFMRHCEG